MSCRDEKRFIDEVLLQMERSERRTVARFEATMEEIQQQLKRLEPPPADA